MVFVPSSRMRVPLHHFIELHHKTYVGIRQVRPCLKYRLKVLVVVWSQLEAVAQVTDVLGFLNKQILTEVPSI